MILKSMENIKVFIFLVIEFLQPYFRDPHILKLYGLNTGIVYDSQADDVYTNLYTDFMKNEVARV